MVYVNPSPENPADRIIFFSPEISLWQLMKAIAAQHFLMPEKSVPAGITDSRKE